MALALPSLLILSFICPWTVLGLFSTVSTLPHFMNPPLTVFFFFFLPTIAQKAVILKVGLELFYIITEPFL